MKNFEQKYIRRLNDIISTEDEFLEKQKIFLVNLGLFKKILKLKEEELIPLEMLETSLNALLQIESKSEEDLPLYKKVNIFKQLAANSYPVDDLKKFIDIIAQFHKYFVSTDKKPTNSMNLIYAPMAPIANYTDITYLPWLDQCSKKINTQYEKLDAQDPLKIAIRNDQGANGNPLVYFRNSIISVMQRLSKYPLLFEALETATEDVEEISKETKQQLQDLTTAFNNKTVKLDNSKTARKTNSPLKKETFYNKALANRDIKIKLFAAGERDLINAKDHCYLFIAKILQVTNYYCGTPLQETDLKDSKPKKIWQIEATKLAELMASAYLKLPEHGHKALVDMVKSSIRQMKPSNRATDNPLIGSLEQLISKDFEEGYPFNEVKLPMEPTMEDVQGAITYINKHIVNQTQLLMKGYSFYFSNKATHLEREAYKKISDDIEKFISADQSDNATDLRLQIIAIFQKHITIIGEHLLLFFQGKFGEMLQKIAMYLDNIKPLRHANEPRVIEKTALQLIKSGINASLHMRTDLPKQLTNITAENKTTVTLCANVQRLYDFYFNTGLGKKIFADVEINGNADDKWKAIVANLDQVITKMFFEKGTLADMVIKIRQAATEINQNFVYGKLAALARETFGRNTGSRLAGSLEILADLYDAQQPGVAVKYKQLNHLPHGIIANMKEDEANNYIVQHILQRASRPSVYYYQIAYNRFFSTDSEKLKNNDVITGKLNKLYQEEHKLDAENIDLFKQNVVNVFKEGIGDTTPDSVGQGEFGKAMGEAGEYLNSIGFGKS